MRRKIVFSILLSLLVVATRAQGPNGTGKYYASANGTKGQALKTALYQIIKNPDVDTYDQLWVDYKYSDMKSNGYIWDIYSTKTDFTYYVHQQGITKVTTENAGEGTCYNREHSFPKSWFGGIDALPMATDLMHVFPADYYVNSRRNNYPYGTTTGDAYVSDGGYSKFGTSTNTAYTGNVFEPNDELKGDLARVYFYMATCYEDSIEKWTSVDGNKVGEIFTKEKYSPYASWMMSMLMEWAKNDPVSQKEVERNQVVYKVQGNRNPFVDFPGLEEYIWGDKKTTALDYEHFAGATYGGVVVVEPETPYDASTVAASTGVLKYQKVEYAGDLELGASYLIVNENNGRAMGKAMMGGSKKDTPIRESITVQMADSMFQTELGTEGKPYEVILGGKRGAYTLYDPVAGKYVALTSDKNQLHTVDAITAENAENAQWTIKFEGGNAKVKNKKYPSRFIGYNVSNPRFATYATPSTYVQYTQLYKKVTGTSTNVEKNWKKNHVKTYHVYTPQGTKVRSARSYANAIKGLPTGVYVVNGRKLVVK